MCGFAGEAAGDDTRMESNGGDASWSEPVLQFLSEEDISEFRVAIGFLRGVALGILQVFDIQPPEDPGGLAGCLDNRCLAGKQRWHEQAGEQERSKVVDLESNFMP